jgi:hypothetical protein
MTKGCFKGVARWLPVGFGAACYYGVESSLRQPLNHFVPKDVLEFPSKLMGGDEKNKKGGASSPVPPPLWAAIDSYDTSSWLSKMLAGTIAGTAGSAIPFARRWPGFRTPSALAATVAACSVGALMMPEYEELEERSIFSRW